jgi:hypothetical protein
MLSIVKMAPNQKSEMHQHEVMHTDIFLKYEDLICLTIAALRSQPENHAKTPSSLASFHMTPWPPGLRTSPKG